MERRIWSASWSSFAPAAGLDGIADGVRAVRLQLVEAAGVVIASDEEIRGRSQKDGQQREELVVDVADDQLVRLGALLQDIQVLR